MKPILFNTDMVRALLEGRKTVTRRVIRPQPLSKLAYICMGHKHGQWAYPDKNAWKSWDDEGFRLPDGLSSDEKDRHWTPPCHTGDILYVRETWARSMAGTYLYKATDTPIICDRWHPSIHMPRDAARIFLRVTGVRVERLQDCGKGWCIDIEKEGVVTPQDPILYINDDEFHNALRDEFKKLWNSTFKPADLHLYDWDANPWVWVIEFERFKKPN